MVRTHPDSVRARMVKFIELALAARIDVDVVTSNAVIKTIFKNLESHRRTKRASVRGAAVLSASDMTMKSDYFSQLFDDDREGNGAAKRMPIERPPPPEYLASGSLDFNFLTPQNGLSAGTPSSRKSGKWPSVAPNFLTSMIVKNKSSESLEAAGTPFEETIQQTANPPDSVYSATIGNEEDGLGPAPSKEFRHITKRYTSSSFIGDVIDKKFLASRQEVDDVLSGKVDGAAAAYSLEVELKEVTSLPNQTMTPMCTLSLGGEVLKAREANLQRKQGGHMIWNETLLFENVYNTYGTDLVVTIHFQDIFRIKNIFEWSSSEKEYLRAVIPLASLDLDERLDDWYLLSNCDGMIRLRLLLRPTTKRHLLGAT
jgi:hypothetical protein